jgi:membrane fusion protein (multidrug efflux system)
MFEWESVAVSTIATKKPATASEPPAFERKDGDDNRSKSGAKEYPAPPPITEKAPPSGVRRRLLIAGVAVVAAIAAWNVRGWLGTRGQDTAANGKATLGFVADGPNAGQDASSAARIETVCCEAVDRNETLRLTGTLTADVRSSVASNVSGLAAEVFVDRGSVVREGEPLVQIDAADAKFKYAEGLAMVEELKARLGITDDGSSFDPLELPEVKLAKAVFEQAQRNLDRVQRLAEKKVVSQDTIEQAQTEYELALNRHLQALYQSRQAYQACKTAQVRAEILDKAVKDTTILAPFDGWVAEKLVDKGEQISAGMQATKVVTLVKINPLRLSLTVPQQSIAHVQKGQKVRFRVDAYPNREFVGTVQFVAPMVADNNRSMTIEAAVPNEIKDGRPELIPGLFVTAELKLQKTQPKVFAPLSAVQWTGEQGRVFVVRDGVAREQVVQIGEIDRDSNKVEILSGLNGKETLVARPGQVRDGVPVRP